MDCFCVVCLHHEAPLNIKKRFNVVSLMLLESDCQILQLERASDSDMCKATSSALGVTCPGVVQLSHLTDCDGPDEPSLHCTSTTLSAIQRPSPVDEPIQ